MLQMRFFRVFFLAAFIVSSMCAVQVNDKVREDFLSGLSFPVYDQQSLVATGLRDAFNKLWSTDFDSYALVPYELNAFSFDLVAKNTSFESVADYSTLKNLNVIESMGATGGALTSFLEQKTIFGKVYANLAMSNPTADVDTLSKRQRVLRFLNENPEIAAKINRELAYIARAQEDLISLWKIDNDPAFTQFVRGRIYWPKGSLEGVQQSQLYQQITSLWSYYSFVTTMLGCDIQQAGIAYFMGAHNATSFITYYGNTLIGSPDGFILGGPFLARSTCQSMKNMYDLVNDYGIKNSWFFCKLVANRVGYKAIAKMAALGVLGLGIQAGGKYLEYNSFISREGTLDFLHKKLNAVALVVRSMKRLSNIITASSELNECLEYAGALQGYFTDNGTVSQKMFDLCDTLRTNTFRTESRFSLRGRVKAAYLTFQEVKDEFGKALAGIGELDTYSALVNLMNAHENTEKPFVFVSYVTDSARPYINFENAWHPLVKGDVVSHTLTIGGNEPQNIVITGPNAGGKTTFLKEVATLLIWAQTFGIVPAQKLELTTFSAINAYMSIVDNLAVGESLGQAEGKRIRELLNVLSENQKKGLKTFTIIDELLSGTEATAGARISYQVGEKIGRYSTGCTLIATHFIDTMTQLESESPAYRNYKVDLDINPDGTLHYLYTVTRGVNRYNVAHTLIGDLDQFDDGLSSIEFQSNGI